MLRRVVRWFRARTKADPGWRSILAADAGEWDAALARARSGPRVLLATSLGGYWAGTTLESLLAVALTLRGARVEVLLCDGVLPACQMCESRAHANLERFARRGPQASLCGGCFRPGRKLFESLGIPVHLYSERLAPEDIEAARRTAAELPAASIPAHTAGGIRIGEHALAGALRFFARGDLDGEPAGEPVLRRYLQAAMTAYAASHRLFTELRPDVAVFHHGIYVPQGLIGEAARQAGVRVVNWNPAYRKRCFIFSHGDTYHHTLLGEPESAWESMPWSDEAEDEILRYLKSRWRGSGDWIWFHEKPDEDVDAFARAAGLDLSRPFVGLLTNVVWDAQLHFPRSAFPCMRDWLVATVKAFAERPGLQLVIRVHPAEVRGTLPSRQRVVDELDRAFPSLPPNVFVVPPESRLSTYALMERANAALIYGTKTGVELAAMGLPVIVAGEAWVRGKGFTHDARSPADYARWLGCLPFAGRMSDAATRRARQYAFHFFLRRMIPLECMEPTGGDPPYALRLKRLSDLAPGRMPGLDVITAGILSGEPFVYPAEAMVRAAVCAPA